MRILASILAAALFLVATTAQAGAVCSYLRMAANRSANGLRAHAPAGTYDGTRVNIRQDGRSAKVAIERFGRRPGTPSTKPERWYSIQTADFAKIDGKWQKLGRWKARKDALTAP